MWTCLLCRACDGRLRLIAIIGSIIVLAVYRFTVGRTAQVTR
jgi:hypothetical protein